jgi:hypothetical protein
MEGELWKRVYRIVQQVSNGQGFVGKQHSDRVIVLTFLWAVLHDRPVSWACRQENWPADERSRRRPSPSTMSRRLRSESCRQLLDAIERDLGSKFPRRWCQWIDARPLPVGGSTQDPEAGFGRAAGCKAKGYKLYMICDSGGAVRAWDVQAMNVSELSVARQLIRQVDGEGYLVGDKLYDANGLYDLAAARGLRLVAPKRDGRGLGHHRHSPHRLASLALTERAFGQALLVQRYDIDRFFGNMSSFGGGLGPLPAWVRRLRRVRQWVQGKLILNAVRVAKRQRLVA